MDNKMNMVEIGEVTETGTEIVSKVAGNNDLLKKLGKAGGYAVAGALAWEGGKRLIRFIGSKVKKNDADKSESHDEMTENVED